jgi:hypothetical protein
MIKKHVIGEVFSIFATDYRSLWTSSADADLWPAIIKRWQDGLSKFNEETILSAARDTYKFFSVSPPTLGQFYELCKKYRKDKEVTETNLLENQETKVKCIEDLTKLKPISPIAEENINKIKELLRKKGLYLHV